MFTGAKLTTNGRNLLAKLIAESRPLTISKIAIGSGYTDESTEDFTNLISEKMRKDIESISYNSGVSMVRATFSNESLESGFHVREIGIFAVDPDDDSIVLYAYDNAGNGECDYLQEGSNTIVNIVVEEAVSFGNVKSVQLTVNPQMAFATMEQFNQLNETIGDKNELPTKDKSSLVNAIKEVFTLGNEKKSKLVENLIAMGVTASTSESWESLLSKVLTIFVGIDVSDTTAVAGDVISGKYFYTAQGVRTQGEITKKSGNTVAVGCSYGDSKLITKINRGAYLTNGSSGYPEVTLAANILANALGITADKIVSGNIICGVPGSTLIGKKFASGYIANVEYNSGDVIHQSCCYYSGGITSTDFRYIDITCSFVPSLIIVVCDLASGTNKSIYTAAASKYTNNNPDNMQFNAFLCENQRFEVQTEVTFGTTTRVPFSSSNHTGKVNITWYAYE